MRSTAQEVQREKRSAKSAAREAQRETRSARSAAREAQCDKPNARSAAGEVQRDKQRESRSAREAQLENCYARSTVATAVAAWLTKGGTKFRERAVQCFSVKIVPPFLSDKFFCQNNLYRPYYRNKMEGCTAHLENGN